MCQRLLVIGLLMGLLAGCNTMRGMGQDIERGGEKVQDAAQQTQQKMKSD